MQKAGGRGGRGPSAAAAFALWAMSPRAFSRDCVGINAARFCILQERREAFEQHIGGVFAGARQRALAEHAGVDVGAAQFDVDRLLDVVGKAFLDHQHGALAGAEGGDFFRHQRIDDVEHQHRHARFAEYVGQPHALERAQHAVGQTAHDDDADVGDIAVDYLVELVFANESARGGQALLDLQPLLREDHRRMCQPPVFEARRTGELVEPGYDAFAIVLRGEFAGGVTGADAQLQHHRRMACFRQFEPFSTVRTI